MNRPQGDVMDTLQVVLTYDTSRQYRLRCLPGFMNKKYINRHILDGLHQTLEQNATRNNEIYVGSQHITLTKYQEYDPKEELILLFTQHGISGTFKYLDTVAYDAMVNHELVRQFASHITINADQYDNVLQYKAESDLYGILGDMQTIILPYKISEATVSLLNHRTCY